MRRRQRAGRQMLLGLLVVLGILGMHGTPAMASSSVAPGADRTSMTTHAVTVMAEMASTEREAPSGVLPAPADGHHQPPAEHHMLTLCLANAAPVVLLGGHPRYLTEAALTAATLPTSLAAEITSRDCGRPPPPPDLQKLCICRT